MFTRLKTQRNGFKLSLNNIKNSSVSRVIALNAATTTSNLNAQHQHENNSNNNLTINVDRNNNNNDTQLIEKISLTVDHNEFIDENHINFIKSLWKKYENDIGNPNGPIRYVDTKDDSHLKNFKSFDIEHWWAERAINLMIHH